MRMVKIIGLDFQWINLDAVTRATASASSGKTVLSLIAGDGIGIDVTDPDQVKKLAEILGIEDLPVPKGP